jgi:hypothetical protein
MIYENNLKPIEVNKKPAETVYELKNEVPGFEEFMKTYEADENLNYDDLNISDIGIQEGYGPCKNSGCDCYCSSYNCICSDYTKYQEGGSGAIKFKKKFKGKKTSVGFQHLIHDLNDYGDRNGAPTKTARSEWNGSGSVYSDGDGFQVGNIKASAGASAG